MAISGSRAPAEICYTGTWAVKPHQGETPSLALHYPAGLSHCSNPTNLKSLGISSEQLNGSKNEVTFELRRAAGTFACSGEAGDGIAGGAFRFRPDAGWSAEVQALGLLCSLSDQILAAMGDVSVAGIRDIKRDFPAADLFAIISSLAVQHRLSNAHAFHEFHEAFPDASLHEILKLGMSRATPELVASLRSAGVHDLTPDNVTALRSVGIDQEFVGKLSAAGKIGLSVDEVAALKSSGF